MFTIPAKNSRCFITTKKKNLTFISLIHNHLFTFCSYNCNIIIHFKGVFSSLFINYALCTKAKESSRTEAIRDSLFHIVMWRTKHYVMLKSRLVTLIFHNYSVHQKESRYIVYFINTFNV